MNVQKRRVENFVLDQVEGSPPTMNRSHLVPALLKAPVEELANFMVILNE